MSCNLCRPSFPLDDPDLEALETKIEAAVELVKPLKLECDVPTLARNYLDRLEEYLGLEDQAHAKHTVQEESRHEEAVDLRSHTDTHPAIDMVADLVPHSVEKLVASL